MDALLTCWSASFFPPRLTVGIRSTYRSKPPANTESSYSGDDELVFPSRSGNYFDPEKFKLQLDAALPAAGVQKKLRPFHDLRHTAITRDAAAGATPIAVMTKAGHASMTTTKRYLHLAGTVFRDEADRLERTRPDARPGVLSRTLYPPCTHLS